MARVYQRIRTAIPDFWSEELMQLFKLWLNDMNNGLNPYTPVTAQTFERRFILIYPAPMGEGKPTTNVPGSL